MHDGTIARGLHILYFTCVALSLPLILRTFRVQPRFHQLCVLLVSLLISMDHRSSSCPMASDSSCPAVRPLLLRHPQVLRQLKQSTFEGPTANKFVSASRSWQPMRLLHHHRHVESRPWVRCREQSCLAEWKETSINGDSMTSNNTHEHSPRALDPTCRRVTQQNAFDRRR